MGFAHIATVAGVPVVPIALDWGRREITLGAPVELAGDTAADEIALRSWFTGATWRNPEHAYQVRPRDTRDASVLTVRDSRW